VEQDGTPVAAARSIFVDASGRRGRLLVRVFWVLGAVLAAYVGVVLLALVGPPGLSRLAIPGLGPVLPGPGAAPLRATTGGHGSPGRLLPRPGETRAPVVSSVGPTSAPTAGVPTSSPRPAPAATPSASARPRPSTPASAAPGRTTAPSTAPSRAPAPGPSKTPPGQSTARPTPRSTHARAARPSPTP
jgi:hypothetical protein